MKNKKKETEVAYLRLISEESKKINNKLEADLRQIIKKGESLNNYEIWINKKCNVFIRTDYIIKIVEKDFENEKISYEKYKNDELVYVIVRTEETDNK